MAGAQTTIKDQLKAVTATATETATMTATTMTMETKAMAAVEAMLQRGVLCLHHYHASCHHDVPHQLTQRSGQFGVKAVEMTARKPAVMVGGCVFASQFTSSKNTLTTTQQRLLVPHSLAQNVG
jgi:hypothetical protein